MLREIVKYYSYRSRKKRAKVFINYLNPSENDRILDLGSDDGSHLASIIPYRKNVYIADISEEPLMRAKRRFGFKTILLDESGKLHFSNNQFDIVFCSSVIEHVTVNKNQICDLKTNKEFNDKAYESQNLFASEIRRIGKKFFVQTPNKYFIIESHTWLPVIIVFLPRKMQMKIIKFCNKFWIKKTSPDWLLLTKAKMQELFPDAEILIEKSFGISKSFIAIRR